MPWLRQHFTAFLLTSKRLNLPVRHSRRDRWALWSIFRPGSQIAVKYCWNGCVARVQTNGNGVAATLRVDWMQFISPILCAAPILLEIASCNGRCLLSRRSIRLTARYSHLIDREIFSFNPSLSDLGFKLIWFISIHLLINFISIYLSIYLFNFWQFFLNC